MGVRTARSALRGLRGRHIHGSGLGHVGGSARRVRLRLGALIGTLIGASLEQARRDDLEHDIGDEEWEARAALLIEVLPERLARTHLWPWATGRVQA